MKEYEGEWNEGKREGWGISYGRKGMKEYEGNYKSDERVGIGREYWCFGGIKSECVWNVKKEK